MVAAPSLNIRPNEPVEKLLVGQRIFLPSRNLEARANWDHVIESRGLKISIAGEIDDIALLRSIAISGSGIVLLPKLGVEPEIKSNTLTLCHEFQKLKQNFYAITREKKFPNPVLSDLLKATLSD